MFIHSQDSGSVFPLGTAQQSMYAKQIVRIAVAQTAIALGQAMDIDEPNTQPLEHTEYLSVIVICFTMFSAVVIAWCTFCFMIPEPEPENSDDDESEGEASRHARYMASSLEEVSDPEHWQSLHHHSYETEDEE